MTPERFRFPDDALRAAAGRTRRRLGLALLAAAAGIAVFWAAALRPQGAGAGTLAFSFAFLLALAALSLRKRLRRLHARWGSYEIAIDAEAIERQVAGVPPLRMTRAEVVAVEERTEGLLLRSRSGATLLVPRGLGDFVRAHALLGAWAPPHR